MAVVERDVGGGVVLLCDDAASASGCGACRGAGAMWSLDRWVHSSQRLPVVERQIPLQGTLPHFHLIIEPTSIRKFSSVSLTYITESSKQVPDHQTNRFL